MIKEDLKGMRKDITALIDDIKYQSDTLTDLERLPVIQLKVLLAKIGKLNQSTAVLLHFIEKQGKLHERVTKAIEADKEAEKHIPEQPPKQFSEEVKEDSSTQSTKEEKDLNRIKVTDLMNAFGINEKYLFASELFKGDMEKFTSVVNEINALTDLESVKVKLTELGEIHEWDQDNEYVINFISLAERKFE